MKTTNLSKIVSNISWLLGDKLVDIILRITVGVLVARYLGPEWFGYLNYSLALIAILAPLVKLGLVNIVVKYISLEPERSDEILGTAFTIQLFSATLITLCVLWYFGIHTSDENVTNWLVSILSVTLIFQCSELIAWWNQSQITSKYTVWSNRIAVFFGLGIKLALIQISASFSLFVWAWVAQAAVKAYFLFHFYLKKNSFAKWKFNGKLAIELLKNSWPLLFASIASIIYLKIDMVMLGNMQSGREVGIYAAAVRISELLYFLPNIVAATLLPTIIRSSKLNQEIFYGRIQALLDVLSIYSILLIAALFFGADVVVSTLFGNEYSDASLILKIHAFALLFVAAGVARNKLLIAENQTIFIMVATILGAVSNILLNLYLIPRYSGAGAAVATIVSYCLSSYLACLFWQPTLKHFRMISASFLVLLRPKSLILFLISLLKHGKDT